MKTLKKLISLSLMLFLVYANLNTVASTENMTESDVHIYSFDHSDDTMSY